MQESKAPSPDDARMSVIHHVDSVLYNHAHALDHLKAAHKHAKMVVAALRKIKQVDNKARTLNARGTRRGGLR